MDIHHESLLEKGILMFKDGPGAVFIWWDEVVAWTKLAVCDVLKVRVEVAVLTFTTVLSEVILVWDETKVVVRLIIVMASDGTFLYVKLAWHFENFQIEIS